MGAARRFHGVVHTARVLTQTCTRAQLPDLLDAERLTGVLKDLRSMLPGLAFLIVLLYTVQYTATVLGQVFIPFREFHVAVYLAVCIRECVFITSRDYRT